MFLKSLVKEGLKEVVKEEKKNINGPVTDVVTVQGEVFKGKELPMDILIVGEKYHLFQSPKICDKFMQFIE